MSVCLSASLFLWGSSCGFTYNVKDRRPYDTYAGALMSTKVMSAVKERALNDKFKPASAILEEVNGH